MAIQFNKRWNASLQMLYGAVVDEDRYIDFLDHMQKLIEARFLVLGMFDPHDPERNAHRFSAPRAIGFEGAAEFLGLAAQSHTDGSDSMLDAGPREILLDFEVYSDRETLDARPTMKLLREKYDAQHIGVVNAQANKAWVDYLMFAHHQDDFQEAEKIRDAVNFFVPHIGVASEIRRAFAQLQRRYQAVFSALNFLRYGVALIIENGETLLTNQTFDAMLDRKDGLVLSSNKKLSAVSTETDGVFQKGLLDAIGAARGGNTSFRETCAIERLSDATPYILDFAPFCDEVSGELNQQIFGALLFMVDPDEAGVLSHKGLSTAFGFTQAEDIVCRQVLDGFSNNDIADANNVALPTVKSQVSSIFAKSRVSDRAGLTRLASKVTPPLIDPDEDSEIDHTDQSKS